MRKVVGSNLDRTNTQGLQMNEEKVPPFHFIRKWFDHVNVDVDENSLREKCPYVPEFCLAEAWVWSVGRHQISNSIQNVA